MNASSPLPRDCRVAVIGAGAVGCYYGGLLARAGLPVTLIGRPAGVQAIRKNGLSIHTAGQQLSANVSADDRLDVAREANLILVCVKSADTAQLARDLAPLLAPGALVMSLQNGVTNADDLTQAISTNDVVASAVYVATEMDGPHTVRHHGGGALSIGSLRSRPVALERMQALVELFQRAGIAVSIAGDITAVLWTKLVVNCAYNALSAITQNEYSALVASEPIHSVMHSVIDEVQTVAQAAGIDLGADLHARVFKVAEMMPRQRSSTAQDLARRRKTEIDFLNGHIVREGERLGIQTPTNRTLHAIVKQIEAGFDR